ncbi:WhiB family transcriptional regulator [Nonomuraea dietziae]|uniref:WhiB family transcriptional regulator n=1 Tax=Nonomuraea dietziae TaxID=65515 RepID=UPI00341136A2
MARKIRRACVTPGWHEQAACKGVDHWVFCNDEAAQRGGEPRPPYNDEDAKSYCAGCPVINECREEALRMRDFFMTRGGMNEDELRAEHRRRQRTSAA